MKKKYLFNFCIIPLIMILFCVVFIYLVTLPACTEQFNLTTKGNIGSSIGGITAPVIGIITSILLYLTLTRQNDSNEEQRAKNETDFIFMLFNQLNIDINNFFYSRYVNKVEKVDFGLLGLINFGRYLEFEFPETNTENIPFERLYPSGQILLIIKSYQLIENRINNAVLSKDNKETLILKLKLVYDCILKKPLNSVNRSYNKNELLRDDVLIKIHEFVETNGINDIQE